MPDLCCFFRRSLSINSAIGDRQIFPWHTNMTERIFFDLVFMRRLYAISAVLSITSIDRVEFFISEFWKICLGKGNYACHNRYFQSRIIRKLFVFNEIYAQFLKINELLNV